MTSRVRTAGDHGRPLQRADVAAAELAPDEAAQLQVGEVLQHLARRAPGRAASSARLP